MAAAVAVRAARRRVVVMGVSRWSARRADGWGGERGWEVGQAVRAATRGPRAYRRASAVAIPCRIITMAKMMTMTATM